MARISKQGLDYFPMDIDIFTDLKIRKLIKYQGGKAISVYALLLCNIYKNGYYMEWDKELPFICSEMTGFDEAYISEVIKSCLTLGLFSKELFDKYGVLTSKGIQERYSHICQQCRRVCNITDYCLLDDRQAPQSLTPQKTQPNRQKVEKKGKQKDTLKPSQDDNQETHLMTLDQEIERLKSEDYWIEQLQMLHAVSSEEIKKSLDEFRLQCIADGKERGHPSLSDAKKHFNSWLRLVKTKNKEQDVRVKTDRHAQRKGVVLSPNQTKTYEGAF